MPTKKVARPDSVDDTDSGMDRKIQDRFLGECKCHTCTDVQGVLEYPIALVQAANVHWVEMGTF